MLSRIQSILNQNGFTLYTEPYRLNIVGLRSTNVISNRFDDEIHVFYHTGKGVWNYRIFKATTDPGTYWLEHPYTPQGTAILAQGQFIDAYAIGLHRGQYQALVQVGSLSILRDYDRKAVIDLYNGTKITGSGFGINIHRANITGTTKYVDANSAGCQVFQDEKDFEEFMGLCYQQAKLYGNRFTYTLIDFRAIKRETMRRVALGSTAACTIALGLYLARPDFNVSLPKLKYAK
jgi:hypothetical protein